ncbi:MAG TPA: aminopeptidase N [Propionibacteriaceae bacterium]|nr:aminopeptidase N [Propionibacteriaceae bacterium]
MSEPAQLSLQRSEAVQRAENVSDAQVLVELDLTGTDEQFASTTTLTFSSAAGGITFLDFQGDECRSATVNGRKLPASAWRAGRISLPDLQPMNTVVVDGLMRYSNDGEGMHRHVDPADGSTYLYAMSFLNAAPRWFACFDQPDLKANYEFRVRAPQDWVVLGNGPSRSVAPGLWQLLPLRPLSTYFVTLVAGPYASVTDEHDGIPLGFHVRASLADALRAEAADLIAVTKASFDYYHRVFGIRYPFGDYHQAFVPDFNAGAMENPGCVTLRDSLIFRSRATRSERAGRATTMAHEMAHMWFGDLVTMTWWDDLWLNESFAEYVAHRVSEEATGYASWGEFGISRKDWGSVADQSPSTHPVAGNGAGDADQARQNFDGISYAKGAAVLKQLAAYLGEDVFWSGLRTYLSSHSFGNAELADLISTWTLAGAVGLDQWAADWLQTTGMDTLDVTDTAGAATIVRTPPRGTHRARRHAIKVGAVAHDGRLTAHVPVLLGDEPVAAALPVGTALVVPDAGDDTWAKIRFGTGGWTRVASVLPTLADAAARVVIYNSIRDAVRDAELAPALALDLVCDSLAAEPTDVVLSEMLGFALNQLAGGYASPADRVRRRDQVHAAARALLDLAPAGSDRQLAAFRSVVASCADADALRGWRSSTGLPDGVELDPELAWAVVEQLAALTGDVGVIEEAARSDRSGAGLAAAARARARLPTSAAKEAAWRLLMEPSASSAYELYATAQGFFDPLQSSLTEGYVGRYFNEVPETANFRQGWALGRVARLAYPASATTGDNLRRGERALQREDLAPPVRRALVDGTDQLRRGVESLGHWS